ncbi:DUF2384 domain-containing protein [Altererythrobacter indicus]|uniref:DUF2384 domain-containing protein n=1 Tax=Altericroceibacterium indicum TaxID=374177 RepID=A0A845ADM9_9SPHN|nr:antitoxin Xre/MbcA/ParS toxin-binding domain-containing protein [Altericroceibacterium indicum]MXP27081.1 DUF2384 domain-containing protein [Altericroceibacterium indicum]
MLLEIPRTQAEPDNPAITQEEAAAAARAIVVLFGHWGVTDEEACQILGGLSLRSYARWKKGDMGRIDRDRATRLSLLLGIHKALRYLFSDVTRAYAWVKQPNATFGGQRALDVMLGGSIFALQRVRAYLDAERGGW